MTILKRALLSHGVQPEQLLGQTEKFRNQAQMLRPGISITKQFDMQLKQLGKTRCREIDAWLANHKKCTTSGIEIANFIAIDDMDLLGGSRSMVRSKFVLTDIRTGFTAEKAVESIQKLLSADAPSKPMHSDNGTAGKLQLQCYNENRAMNRAKAQEGLQSRPSTMHTPKIKRSQIRRGGSLTKHLESHRQRRSNLGGHSRKMVKRNSLTATKIVLKK